MASIHFEFPVWVQYKNKQYIIRPLFVANQSVANDRYERAMKGLIKSVRNEFKNYKTNRANLDYFLWYLFNPDFKYLNLKLEFSYGQRYFHGQVATAWFEHNGYTVVTMPAFDNLWFIMETRDPKKADVVREVEEQIQRFGRRYKKEYDEEFLMEPYQANGKEFCTAVDMYMHTAGEKITLGYVDDDMFQQFFRPNATFEGRDEIEKVGFELNDLYPSELNRAFYQDELVTQLDRLIYNRENVPMVILGPRRVGKSTLLHEVVHRYLERNTEKELYHLDNIWNVDPSRLIAGMSIVGMWQRRFESIIRFAMNPITEYPRRDKLYFNNIIALFRIGKSAQNDMTLSDVLKPYLQKREIQVVLEATPEEWDIASELDRGFTDLFKVVRLYEPTETKSLRIINKVRVRLESEHDFKISNTGLLRLIELQKRFNQNMVLIGAIAENLHQLSSKYSEEEVTPQTIVEEFSSKTHLNERLADPEVKITKDEFQQYISRRLVGQQDAVDCLTDVLHVIKAQLNNPERPFGSYLFIGPTGVGKTQAAKVVAKYLFNHEDSLVRFDMNEFIDGGAVSRLVGDLDYPEGQLTTKIRYNPYCVLLFDEIEKAHPDVHNLLLQVLGEGRLTDALGRTISFCNTVIIMTSNLGAERVGKEINIQRRADLASSTYEKSVRDFFRPEFINRIDNVIIFNKLNLEHIGQIAWLQIKELLKRHGFMRRHTILNVSEEVLQKLAENGFDPEMGGRALKRQIEKELTVLIADQLVETLPDTPVIFNLFIQDHQLKPLLTRLEHIEAFDESAIPKIGDFEVGIQHFEYLLTEIEQLKAEMFQLADDEDNAIIDPSTITDYSLIHMKEDVLNIEQKVRNIIYEYQTQNNFDLSQSNVQIRYVAQEKLIKNDNSGSKVEKKYFKELYSELEIYEYLEEVAQATDRIVRESDAMFFEVSQAWAWIRFYYHHYEKNGLDRVMICVISRVEKAGQDEVKYLKKLYERIHPVEQVIEAKDNEWHLYLNGPGLFDLFSCEVGFHMFFTPHETPLPVEVSIHRLGDDETPETFVNNLDNRRWQDMVKTEEGIKSLKKVAHIIRLYAFSDLLQRKGSITDLRTGIINYEDLTDAELKFLFYANFDAEFKLNVEAIEPPKNEKEGGES
ncbi:AAA family ATPase [uncultured Microscilla sp.]|uniref:AAA family ATPase n=1 Tax=uncultured Microscilla sp. TaxID=432653 RepID=UPI0026045CF4|nr:AAA family ATPase [uncultured Microscilla sp.]